MTRTVEEIKYRLSNIGEAIGGIALEYITGLEKENKELHVTNKSLLESCEGATMMYEHLTKAKKIIQRLVTKLYKYTRFTDDVLAEAEQFLKECEE